MSRRLAILFLLLLQPLSAQTVEMKDLDGDGWVEFQSAELPGRSFASPAPLILELAQSRSLDWFLEEAKRWPDSRQIQVEAARRLWEAERHEESLEFWARAERASDIDFRLEAARSFAHEDRWGEALALLAGGESDWLSRATGIWYTDPMLRRLISGGWSLTDGLTRSDVEVRFERIDEKQDLRSLRMGQRIVKTGEGRIVFPDLGLQLAVQPKTEVDNLTAELAGPEGVVEQLGVSVEGRPIEAYRYGTGSQTVVFFGAFHGDEPESAEVVRKFAQYLAEHPTLCEDRRAVLIPVVNPDGLSKGRRKNSNQVDLNRNFPTENWNSEGEGGNYWGGPAPASEPETAVVVKVLERFKPDRIISIHCPYKCVNYDGPAQALAEAMSAENGYKVEPSIGYPTPGSFGTYSGIERKIPTITLELPPTGEEDVWTDNREALVKALRGVD
ncbi:MAG: murein peptide amidase A [Candidatus Eremiobacteraeota bacterium]|nr:murein peptide amidase A [Candidatus Eremiobacteraeota bacterium]